MFIMTMDGSIAKSFPFTTVIVTNPDEASAKSAQQLLDSTLKHHLRKLYPQQDVTFLSTCDPFGARCGSFGGTLAAVDLIRENNSNNLEDETILCLHAGGDSSRCPLSMILGKAWQELPSKQYRNPTFWLIHQLEELFRIANIPKGSLIVAATDCLISLGTTSNTNELTTATSISKDDTDPWAVLGVGVPAPLHTAKNHGVYIMPDNINSTLAVQIEDPVDVWQKPSVEQLSGTCNGTSASFDVKDRSGRQAWIDVGIVIFYPKAFETLVGLSEGLLSKCTRRGLEVTYRQSSEIDGQPLEGFAKKNALKVDLYTDILHNLPWTNKLSHSTDGDQSSLTASLQNVLSQLSLKVLVLPKGTFLHLGSTQELIEFITLGSHPFDDSMETKAVDKAVTQELATFLHCRPRFQTWHAPKPDGRNVTMRCIFPPENVNVTLGSSTLVEYSDLSGFASVSIGDHCMLSGWRRGTLTDKDDHSHELKIPDGLSVQLLSIEAEKAKAPGNFVLMVLGTEDSIKTPFQQSTLYGVPFDDFIKYTSIPTWHFGRGEVLDDSDCLWTMKIHPVVAAKDPYTSYCDYFSWLEKMKAGEGVFCKDTSFTRWLNAPRVSLRDLHSVADAGKEWEFRNDLDEKIWKLHSGAEIEDIERHLLERCNDIPCDLSWLLELEDSQLSYEALCRLLLTLEAVTRKALAVKAYDVSGRALMLASATLADFIAQQEVCADFTPLDGIIAQCHSLLDVLKRSSTQRMPDADITSVVDEILETTKACMQYNSEKSLRLCSEVFELLALRMTEFTISDGFRRFLDPKESDTIRFCRTNELCLTHRWVISVSPARVDLAGGWSDTPPICYEYGGSVTGMAVLVNNYYPLSCRCRIILGGTGILLRSEMRDISNGGLLTHQQDEINSIRDIKGVREPSSACALIKASLLCLGMVTEKQIKESSAELQLLLNAFCSAHENVRLEIVTTSMLGLGTGMGTSSILGACILQSVAKSVGIGDLDDEALLHAVLMLEQILSSRGGWQDQAHGIFPGVKTVRSQPPQIPMTIEVDPLDLSNDIVNRFEDRLMFAYTGQTRLAKNILQQVLRRWSRRTSEIVSTVESLVKCSEKVRQAYLDQDWDEVGRTMQNGYRMKCLMAGEDSGAEPESVKIFMSLLNKAGLISGAMLCGAGGGGFLLLVLSEHVTKERVKYFFKTEIAPMRQEFEQFSFHDCHIARKGLTTSSIDDAEITSDSFDLAWHRQ